MPYWLWIPDWLDTKFVYLNKIYISPANASLKIFIKLFPFYRYESWGWQKGSTLSWWKCFNLGWIQSFHLLPLYYWRNKENNLVLNLHNGWRLWHVRNCCGRKMSLPHGFDDSVIAFLSFGSFVNFLHYFQGNCIN